MVDSLSPMKKLTSECNIVEVSGSMNGFPPTNIELLYASAKVVDSWMSRIVGTEDLDCFFGAVWLVYIFDYRGISKKTME